MTLSFLHLSPHTDQWETWADPSALLTFRNKYTHHRKESKTNLILLYWTDVGWRATATEMPQGKCQACMTAKNKTKKVKKAEPQPFVLVCKSLVCLHGEFCTILECFCLSGSVNTTEMAWMSFLHFKLRNVRAMWYTQAWHHEPVIIAWTFHNWNPIVCQRSKTIFSMIIAILYINSKITSFNVKNKWYLSKKSLSLI